jgi:hypothetical protein
MIRAIYEADYAVIEQKDAYLENPLVFHAKARPIQLHFWLANPLSRQNNLYIRSMQLGRNMAFPHSRISHDWRPKTCSRNGHQSISSTRWTKCTSRLSQKIAVSAISIYKSRPDRALHYSTTQSSKKQWIKTVNFGKITLRICKKSFWTREESIHQNIESWFVENVTTTLASWLQPNLTWDYWQTTASYIAPYAGGLFCWP